MRVGELIDELKKYDRNREVWLDDSEYGLQPIDLCPLADHQVGRVMCKDDDLGISTVTQDGDCVICSF